MRDTEFVPVLNRRSSVSINCVICVKISDTTHHSFWEASSRSGVFPVCYKIKMQIATTMLVVWVVTPCLAADVSTGFSKPWRIIPEGLNIQCLCCKKLQSHVHYYVFSGPELDFIRFATLYRKFVTDINIVCHITYHHSFVAIYVNSKTKLNYVGEGTYYCCVTYAKKYCFCNKHCKNDLSV